jgi:hypothetical protein
MPTSDEPWQALLDAFGQLRDAWPSKEWTWDHRFKCVTSSLGVEASPELRRLLEPVMPASWTGEAFRTAPPDVQSLRERCGDVRPGQLLLTGPATAGMIPFGLWWPWGDGAKISVRLGIAGCDRPAELYPLLRARFGIA